MKLWDDNQNPWGAGGGSPWAPSGELELGTKSDGSPLSVPSSAFDYHAQVIATTGGGKTKFLERLFQEFARKTQSSVVYLDPTGNAYNFLRRWCYQQNLDHRLVLVDPGETRLVCGFNPVKPWPDDHLLQAVVGWENIRRAMGAPESSIAPLMAQWMCNTLYSLLETGLTMHEAPDVLDLHDGRIRQAVMRRLPPSTVYNDWDLLHRMLDSTADRNIAQAITMWQNQVGSAYRRILQYTRNASLARMLGTTQHVIDWKEILDGNKLVLVNLKPTRPDRQILSDEDMRTFGLQITSQLIEECFKREEGAIAGATPCYLIVDECQYFISSNMEKILAEGRQFLLRLILAHRTLQELVDKQTQDPRLKFLVSGCTHTKVVLGGLGYKDAEEIAQDIYAHWLDPMRIKAEIQVWKQLSEVKRVQSTTTVAGGGRVRTAGGTTGDSRAYDAELKLVQSAQNSTFNNALSEIENYSTAVIEGLMVQPTAPFKETVSRQFMDIREQLHEVMSRMIRKGPREAVIAIGKDQPIDFTVAFVEEPAIDLRQAHNLDLDVMRALPYYSPPELIEEEIRDRQAKLLAPPQRAIELEPTSTSEPVFESPPKLKPKPAARSRKKPTPPPDLTAST